MPRCHKEQRTQSLKEKPRGLEMGTGNMALSPCKEEGPVHKAQDHAVQPTAQASRTRTACRPRPKPSSCWGRGTACESHLQEPANTPHNCPSGPSPPQGEKTAAEVQTTIPPHHWGDSTGNLQITL